MATIKKSKLRETLKTKSIDEGFIDGLIGIIQQRKVDKKSKELTNKLNKTRDNLRDEFIQFYGSYDDIPDSVKKVIEK
jgi:hypothetical protein